MIVTIDLAVVPADRNLAIAVVLGEALRTLLAFGAATVLADVVAKAEVAVSISAARPKHRPDNVIRALPNTGIE